MDDKIKTFTLLSILFLFVNMKAQINELHMLPDSGRSGFPITISYRINNTDQFSAFQFDMTLPSVLTFVEDSIWLFRNIDHFVIANQVNQQTLRIVAFSPTNQLFTGNDGEIVKIMFNLNGIAGTYDVGLNNVIISNPDGENILTGYYPSYVKITSPDISGQTNINFGEISVLDTVSYNYQLNNNGDDTLFVTELFSSEIYFWNETPLPQNIPSHDSSTFNFKFHNLNKGQYSATYTIRSNDPDEDPFYFDAIATSFAPNYILINDAEAYVRDTVTLKINVDNYENFYNIQVDLNFPPDLTYITNSATLTDRKQDHILFVNMLTSNKMRLFTYSNNNLPFLGDTGTVVTMNFVVGIDTGIFPLMLSSGILSDSISQNIIKGSIDGEIHIQKRPSFELSVNVVDGWNIVSAPGINPVGINATDWWPGLTGDVFKFISGTGYSAVTTVLPTEGYWMKHSGATVYNYPEIEVVPHDPINCSEGWILFGVYEEVLDTADLGGIILPVYGYFGNGYVIVDSVFPGYGYWTRCSGQIIFPERLLSNQKKYVANEFLSDECGKIKITDASEKSFTLYAVSGEENLNQYELPPLPPQGMFDIRYNSGRIAEDLNSSIQTIEMSGVEYPLTIRVDGMDIKLMDVTGKIMNVNLKNGEEVVISLATIKTLKVTRELLPTLYELKQNYPNPFNPSTTIEFSIPENVNSVKLSIYNVLGEKVAELVNTSLVAGKYSYQWDAKNAATGIYIYELRTDKFIQVKKMLLLK